MRTVLAYRKPIALVVGVLLLCTFLLPIGQVTVKGSTWSPNLLAGLSVLGNVRDPDAALSIPALPSATSKSLKTDINKFVTNALITFVGAVLLLICLFFKRLYRYLWTLSTGLLVLGYMTGSHFAKFAEKAAGTGGSGAAKGVALFFQNLFSGYAFFGAGTWLFLVLMIPIIALGVYSLFKNPVKHLFIYFMVLPGIVHILIFRYIPMVGLVAAFEDFSVRRGIWGSSWNNFGNFTALFRDKDFGNVIWNTVVINFFNIFVGTVIVVMLAIFLNDIRFTPFRRVTQTLVYLPHFISWVVFAGMVSILLSPSEGVVNALLKAFGHNKIFFLNEDQYIRAILIISNIIKATGYESIVYMANLSSVNPELYECASLDGANRAQMARFITIPSLMPTLVVLSILHIAGIFGSNFEQVYNLITPPTYPSGDVISTFMIRRGLLGGQFGLGSAFGVLFSAVSFVLAFIGSKSVKKLDVMGVF